MLVYVAVGAVLEGRPDGRRLPNQVAAPRRGAGRVLATAAVALITVGWVIRTGECYLQLRDAAWENYQEWTTRYEALGGYTRPQTDVLSMLRTGALAHVPDDPRRDPAWTYTLFEREYERVPD